MSLAIRIDLMRAIGQAYLKEVQPTSITIYGSEIAICKWDTPFGETSKIAVFVYNGTSWCKATNGNKTLCTIAYYQLAIRNWTYQAFNSATGLCLDAPTQRLCEQEAATVIEGVRARHGIME